MVYCASLQDTGCDTRLERPSVSWTQPGQPGLICHSVTKGRRLKGRCKKSLWSFWPISFFFNQDATPKCKKLYIYNAFYINIVEVHAKHMCISNQCNRILLFIIKVQQQCYSQSVNCSSINQKHRHTAFNWNMLAPARLGYWKLFNSANAYA